MAHSISRAGPVLGFNLAKNTAMLIKRTHSKVIGGVDRGRVACCALQPEGDIGRNSYQVCVAGRARERSVKAGIGLELGLIEERCLGKLR